MGRHCSRSRSGSHAGPVLPDPPLRNTLWTATYYNNAGTPELGFANTYAPDGADQIRVRHWNLAAPETVVTENISLEGGNILTVAPYNDTEVFTLTWLDLAGNPMTTESPEYQQLLTD